MTKNMKRTILVTLLALMGLTGMAQSSLRGGQLFLSLPERNTTHARSMKTYELSDKVMGKRTLKSTVYYDRHGYQTSPTHKAAYDSLGRLIYYMVLADNYSVKHQMNVFDTLSFYRITYTPEGWIDRFQWTFYSRVPGAEPDTSITSYRLANSMQDERGSLRLEYRRYHSQIYAKVYHKQPYTTYDTVVFEQNRDEQGRVVTESLASTGYSMDDYYIHIYYDKQGRKARQVQRLYEYRDSVIYQYNILGQMIGWTGKAMGEGDEGDVIVRCLPDGTKSEETQIWPQATFDEATKEWISTQATFNDFYDRRGNLVRVERPDEPIIEYDFEYWDD